MKTIRVFISSPGDVAEERDRAKQVVESLRRRYARHFHLQAILWEELPLEADLSFQDGIDLVLSEEGIDIAVFILWSRLGSPLGALVRKQDGTLYRSGTEREFDLMRTARKNSRALTGVAKPHLLLYTRSDDASFEERLRRKSTEEMLRELEQKRLVEVFIKEEFHDAESGTNAGAYHRFDRPNTFSQRLRVHLTDLLDKFAGGGMNEAVWDVDKQGPPFLGLESFQPQHADVFFGREDEVLEIHHVLREQAGDGRAFVLLSGASGSGKSSLARAGVLPAVQENETEGIATWRTLIVTPSELGANPVEGLMLRLASDAVLPALKLDAAEQKDLVDVLLRNPEDAFRLRIKPAFQTASQEDGGTVKLLLLLDQLEEIFTSPVMTAEMRRSFLGVVESFALSGSVWVVATARSDFNPLIQTEPALVRLKAGRGTVDVLPPEADALRRVIVEPAHLAGLRFEEKDGLALSVRILRDAGAQAELLPLVEYLLRELYEQRTEESLLTFAAYESLGGVEGALARQAEKVFAGLRPDVQETLGKVLKALITFGNSNEAGHGTAARVEKRVIRQRAPLLSFPPDTPARTLIDAFVKERLFSTAEDPQTHEASFTVAHESLLRVWSRAVDWSNDNREFLRTRARIAARQAEETRLVPGDPLIQLARQQLAHNRDGFSQAEIAFIELSIQQEEAATKRTVRNQRMAVCALGILAAGLFVALIVALKATTRAEEGRQTLLAHLHKSAESDLAAAKDMTDKGRHFVALGYLARAAESDGAYAPATEGAALLLNRPIPLRICRGHGRDVHSALFSPDGSSLVSVSADKTARVWSVADGRLKYVMDKHKGDVTCAAYSPDGRWIATGADDDKILVWNTEDGRVIHELKGHEDMINSVCFSADGHRLLTSSDDQTARIWDADRGELLTTLRGHEYGVNAAELSNDGRRVITASSDNTARIWDVGNGSNVVLKGHADAVIAVRFSPDGRWAATAADDSKAMIWDATTGELKATLDHYNTLRDVNFSPDGTRLVTASSAGAAIVYSVPDGRLLARLKDNQGEMQTAVFSPDGLQVLTACEDGSARLWDASAGVLLRIMQGHEKPLNSAVFDKDGRHVVTASQDQSVCIWSVAGAELGTILHGHRASVRSARFSPNGDRVVTASSDKTARIWDAQSGKLSATLTGHEKGVRYAEFSPDGNSVVTAADETSACIWDASKGTLRAALKRHKERVTTASFSPDGSKVVTASTDHTARIWDVKSAMELVKLEGHTDWVNSARFSPDGKRIITASGALEDPQDCSVKLWDAASGKMLASWKEHGAAVWMAQFSPDGTKVATASDDQTARVWDADTGALIRTLQHADAVYSAHFSHDGKHLVTGTKDHECRVWEVEDGALVGVIRQTASWVGDAVFSQDDQRILMACGDGTARMAEFINHVSQTPSWWPDFVRCAAGRTIDGEVVAEEKKAVLFGKITPQIAADKTRCGDFARWFLAPLERRTLRPGSNTVGADFADTLTTESAELPDLLRAYELNPAHPLVRLAIAQQTANTGLAAFLENYDISRLPSSANSQQLKRIAAFKAEPATLAAMRARCGVLEERKEYEKATLLWLKVARMPDCKIEDMDTAAYWAAKNHDEASAREILTAALRRFPDNTTIHRRMGWCMINLNHPAEALEAFNQYDRLTGEKDAPATASFLRGKAIAQWMTGAREEAVTTYREVVKLEPRWAEAKTIDDLKWPVWPDAEKQPLAEIRKAAVNGPPKADAR